jgi:hypothetical protein
LSILYFWLQDNGGCIVLTPWNSFATCWLLCILNKKKLYKCFANPFAVSAS